MVGATGIEPATRGLGNRCSIQLSYVDAQNVAAFPDPLQPELGLHHGRLASKFRELVMVGSEGISPNRWLSDRVNLHPGLRRRACSRSPDSVGRDRHVCSGAATWSCGGCAGRRTQEPCFHCARRPGSFQLGVGLTRPDGSVCRHQGKGLQDLAPRSPEAASSLRESSSQVRWSACGRMASPAAWSSRSAPTLPSDWLLRRCADGAAASNRRSYPPE